MLMLELNRTNIFLNSKPEFNKLLVMFISNKIWNIYQVHDISAALLGKIIRWLSEKKMFQNPWSEANWALALQAERKYGPNLNLKLGWIF